MVFPQENLLENTDIINALLKNAKYPSISKCVSELKAQRDLIKQWNADHAALKLVDAMVMRAASEALDRGIQTAAFTYVLHHLIVKFPQERGHENEGDSLKAPE